MEKVLALASLPKPEMLAAMKTDMLTIDLDRPKHTGANRVFIAQALCPILVEGKEHRVAVEVAKRTANEASYTSPTGTRLVGTIVPALQQSGAFDAVVIRNLFPHEASMSKDFHANAGPAFFRAACEGKMLPALRAATRDVYETVAAEHTNEDGEPANIFVMHGGGSTKVYAPRTSSRSAFGATEVRTMKMPSSESLVHIVDVPHFSRGSKVEGEQRMKDVIRHAVNVFEGVEAAASPGEQ
jgi:hypothetical protein